MMFFCVDLTCNENVYSVSDSEYLSPWPGIMSNQLFLKFSKTKLNHNHN